MTTLYTANFEIGHLRTRAGRLDNMAGLNTMSTETNTAAVFGFIVLSW